MSRARAARESHTTPKTVMRYASVALRKDDFGRYRALPSDGLARSLQFLTAEGLIEITVRSSRTASKISGYMAAVYRYLKTGETAQLEQFRGKAVRVSRERFEFTTDLRTLDRLANAGQVAFEDLYAMST